MRFMKVDSLIKNDQGKIITGPIKELMDSFGTKCANIGFWYGVGAGIFWVGCGVLGWKIGNKIGDKIVEFSKKKKANA